MASPEKGGADWVSEDKKVCWIIGFDKQTDGEDVWYGKPKEKETSTKDKTLVNKLIV